MEEKEKIAIKSIVGLIMICVFGISGIVLGIYAFVIGNRWLGAGLAAISAVNLCAAFFRRR